MPSKKRKSKNKQTKSKLANPKRAQKASPGKHAVTARPRKKAVKKSQSKKSSKASTARHEKTRMSSAPPLESSSSRQSTVSGRQSGDLQDLSRTAQADSERLDQLVEEGNPFEAGAVAGVEEADNAAEREVHTHEVPEDDVPEEYLNKD